MALSSIFYARGDSNSANNAALNVQNTGKVPVTSIQFTTGTGGDLILDYVPDGADANTLPEFDPDTKVIINGVARNFAFVKSGNLDPARTDPPLENAMVYVIKVDMNGNGDLNDKVDQQFFFTTLPGVTPAIMANNIHNGACALSNLDISPPPSPVCFCSGTEIATPSGPRKVETLVAGDVVLTHTGDRKQIVWIASTRIGLAELLAHPNLRPIRIPAGAVGPGLPSRDLRVSPQHRIVLQGAASELLFGVDTVLVAAKFLVGSIAEVAPLTGRVEYFHVLLEEHEMLVSNGIASESFQPARRTMDVMDDAARGSLEAVLAALGTEAMLARKDQFLSLKQPEAAVLLAHVQQHAPGMHVALAVAGERAVRH